MTLRLVLADDSFLVREGIARLLVDAGFEVVAQVGDADGLLRLTREHLPDVARLLGDRRVSEWLWPHGGPTEQELIEGTAEKERHWERHGFGIWLLRDTDTEAAVGWGGLQWT